MFKHRIGPDPHSGGEASIGASGCPDIWELQNGDFAIIGIRSTSQLSSLLPPTAGCGADEEIVIIPRKLLTRAKSSIPEG